MKIKYILFYIVALIILIAGINVCYANAENVFLNQGWGDIFSYSNFDQIAGTRVDNLNVSHGWTIYGTNYNWQPTKGKFNGALNISAHLTHAGAAPTDTYVLLNQTNTECSQNTDFTFCTWFYMHEFPDTITGGYEIFGKFNDAAGNKRHYYCSTGDAAATSDDSISCGVRTTAATNPYGVNTTEVAIDTWHHICMVRNSSYNGDRIIIYLDGLYSNEGTSDDAVNTGAEPLYLGSSGYTGYAYDQNMSIDDTFCDTQALSQEMISELYNDTTLADKHPPPKVNLSNPINDDHVMIQNISFNGNATFYAIPETLSLYINSTGTFKLNQSNITNFLNRSIYEFNLTLDDGFYIWNFQACDNNTNCSFAKDNYTLSVDTNNPAIDGDSIISTNKSFFYDLITAQINATDPNLFQITTLLDGNFTVDNITNINQTSYQYNLSFNIQNLTPDVHILTIRVWDGHTGEKLDEMKSPSTSFGNLKFNNEKNEWFTITPKDYDLFGKTSYTKENDRISFSFEKSLLGNILSKEDEITFEVESNQRIYIPKNRDNKYNGWIVIPKIGEKGRWIDFNLKDTTDVKYKVNQVNDYKAEITISNIPKDKKVLEFESAGELNLFEANYTFYRFNYSITYLPNAVGTVPRTYTLNITKNSSFMTSIDAEFNINGTTYSTNSTHYANNSVFNKTISTLLTDLVTNVSINFTYNITGSLVNITNNTAELNQSIWGAAVAPCNASYPYVLFNISYADETTLAPLNVSNNYNLVIYDGYSYFNQAGLFYTDGDHRLCTSLPPTLVNHTWNMWGTMILNDTGYSPRTISINALAPYSLNNSRTLNLTYLMIDLTNGSLINYKWYNTQFSPITGTMKIYKCNPDGTKTLVDSVVIVSGNAISYINYYYTQYSYTVIANGNLYQDSSFSTCHVEIATPSTYYIDQIETNIYPLIGLYSAKCTLNETGNNTVTMAWEQSPELSDAVSGCIIAYRGTINGKTQIYENCSNSSPITRTIPDNSNPYYVIGELRQGNYNVQCGQELSFFTETDASETFGLTGIFCVIIMVASLALLFWGEGKFPVLGSMIGLAVSWFLGITVIDTFTMSLLEAFLILVAVTGRYNKKS